MKIINVALNTLLVLVIAGAVAFSILPRFGLLNPFELKIVRSGSMEPAIPTGSVVLIQPATGYNVGDVITFGKDTATSIPTSHRIVSIRSEGGTTYYTTKGDANNAADPGETPASKVIGRIIFSLPYVGYIFAFAKTKLGFALLVAIPAALIILYEAIGISKEIALRKRRKKAEGALARIAKRTVDDLNDPPVTVYERPNPMADMFVPHRVAAPLPTRAKTYRAPIVATALLAIIAVPALLMSSSTSAYFSDLEQSTGDTFAAGPLDFSVSVVPPDATLVLGQSGEIFTFTLTPVVGSLPFRYKVSAAASGDAAFCSAITANGSAPLAYSGAASALATGDTNDLAPWSLTLTLPSPSPSVVDGMKCNLDLKYEGYQEGGAVGTEYHDTEHVALMLTADPPTSDSGEASPPLPPLPPSTTAPPPAEDLIITPDAPIVDATTTDTTAGDIGTTTDETVVEPPPSDPPTSDSGEASPPPTDTPPTDTPPTDTPPPADPQVDTPPIDTPLIDIPSTDPPPVDTPPVDPTAVL